MERKMDDGKTDQRNFADRFECVPFPRILLAKNGYSFFSIPWSETLLVFLIGETSTPEGDRRLHPHWSLLLESSLRLLVPVLVHTLYFHESRETYLQKVQHGFLATKPGLSVTNRDHYVGRGFIQIRAHAHNHLKNLLWMSSYEVATHLPACRTTPCVRHWCWKGLQNVLVSKLQGQMTQRARATPAPALNPYPSLCIMSFRANLTGTGFRKVGDCDYWVKSRIVCRPGGTEDTEFWSQNAHLRSDQRNFASQDFDLDYLVESDHLRRQTSNRETTYPLV